MRHVDTNPARAATLAYYAGVMAGRDGKARLQPVEHSTNAQTRAQWFAGYDEAKRRLGQ